MYSKSVFIGVILLLFFACEKNKIYYTDFSVVYLKGSSWTGYSYRAELDQNGVLRIEEKMDITSIDRNSSYQIAKDEMDLLTNKLIKAAKIDFKNDYGFGSNKPFDLPVRFIKYRIGVKTDSTYIYFPDAKELPEELESLLVIIEQVLAENDTTSN